MSITCPLCQTDNPDLATSCSVCGSLLEPTNAIRPLPTTPSNQSPQSASPVISQVTVPSPPTNPLTQSTSVTRAVPPISIPTSTPVIDPASLTHKTKPITQTSIFALPLPSFLQNGRYELQQVLGDGGFAITYKALDVQTHQEVVIKERWPVGGARQHGKVLWPRGSKLREEVRKFQDEAEILQRCNHSSIVRCYDFFEEHNTCYIVMDLVDGQSLHDYVQGQGPLPEPQARKYFIQLAEALEVVHGQKILHRDIKPENIMLDRSGQRAVLIDFGIAREFQENMTQDLTVCLSLLYSPIEQLSKKTKRTASADLFSLCASFYYAVSGQDPVPATDRAKNWANHQPDNLPTPQQLGAQISSELQDIIILGMAMELKERFISATHLLEHLYGNPIPRSLFVLRRKLANQKGKTADLQSIVQEYQRTLQQGQLQPSVLAQLGAELAHILLHLDRTDEAIQAAQAAHQIDPQQMLARGILGLLACREGRWQDAVSLLEPAYNSDPSQCWLGVYFALALIETQNTAKAQTVLQPWLAQFQSQPASSPSTPQNHSSPPMLEAQIKAVGAWLGFHRGDWKAAMRYCRQTLNLVRNTHDSQLQNLKAWIYPCLLLATAEAVKGRGSLDVERCLDEFDQEMPGNGFCQAYRAWYQGDQKSPGGVGTGAGAAISVLQVFPTDTTAPIWVLFNQGVLAEQSQNWFDAEKFYRSVFPRSGADARIASRLGWVLGQLGRWQEAATVMEAAEAEGLGANPRLTELETAQFWHNQGWIMLNLLKTQGVPQSRPGQVPGATHNLYGRLKKSYQRAIEIYRRDSNSQAEVQHIEAILQQLP